MTHSEKPTAKEVLIGLSEKSEWSDSEWDMMMELTDKEAEGFDLERVKIDEIEFD